MSIYSTFKCKLPSDLEIEFRTPTYKDRKHVLRGYNREEGYVPEEALAARCLTRVGGQSVAKDEWEQVTADSLAIMEPWTFKDQQFFLEVFMNMFSLDEERRSNAKELAKKLLMGEDTTTSITK